MRGNHPFAKVSRPEVARCFMLPAPEEILAKLASEGKLTRKEADCAKEIPLAEDITAESDSGGHTDNRPISTLFSRLADLRARRSDWGRRVNWAPRMHLRQLLPWVRIMCSLAAFIRRPWRPEFQKRPKRCWQRPTSPIWG